MVTHFGLVVAVVVFVEMQHFEVFVVVVVVEVVEVVYWQLSHFLVVAAYLKKRLRNQLTFLVCFLIQVEQHLQPF
jgi:hypothetical protein